MSLEGNYSFAGIGAAEAKDRENEHRTGVPPQGGLAALLSAPIKRTTGVRAMNQGSNAALVALAHGAGVKTIAAEALIAFKVSTTVYKGTLQYGSIVPGSVTISEAGALADVVDDGSGVLVDTGTTTVRGSVNYTTGEIDLLWGAGATEPVNAAYQHTDWVQFAVAQTTILTPAGSYPETLSTQFGRLCPGSISLTDGTEVFVDDGKGNMLETTGGISVVRGSVDYATGVITLTGGTGTLTTTTITYSFNPFATLLVAGGAHQGVPLMPSAIPELGSEAFADGVKGESMLALIGECRTNGSTNLVTWWAHHVEEPYRVNEDYTAFPAGGDSNDPRTSSS